MKLVFDANISWRILKIIEHDFPNCFHVKNIDVNQPAKDFEIWKHAKSNGFTIVTHDEDFEKLVLQYGIPPKVIILKTNNQNTKQIAEILIRKKSLIQDFVLNNELMILEIY